MKKKSSRKKRKILSIEAQGEDIYTLIKIILGGVIGVILGIMNVVGVIGFLISVIVLLVFFAVGRHFFKLSNVHPLRLLLWDGTFSFFLFMIVTWAITFNLLGNFALP